MNNNAQRNARGLNENYAREVMELHTLGVDGGYTQTDVTAVARALTGWSVMQEFYFFRPRMHDNEAKTILNKTSQPMEDTRKGLMC